MQELSPAYDAIDLQKSRICRDIFLANLVLQGELGKLALAEAKTDFSLAANSSPIIPSDRTALQVFKEMEDARSIPRFRGLEDYRRFLQEDLLVPGVSSIRISSTAGSDQHYLVGPNGLLAGIGLDAHAGRKGFFHYTQLISPTTLFSPSAIKRPATKTVGVDLTSKTISSSDAMAAFLIRVS